MKTGTSEAQVPEAFRQFEHDGWEAIPDRYDDAFASLTSQAAQPLLDAAEVGPVSRVLDVATGPGYVAIAAAERGATVVGIDFSAAMVERARQRSPHIDFREGDAEALSFAADSFDAVVIGFGLLHLVDPDRALRESQRVLRPGGRCAFTVWAQPTEAVGFGIVLRAIEAHGRLDVPLPSGPPFFRFSDPAECLRSLEAAGFAHPRVGLLPQLWRLHSPDALYEFMLGSTVRTAGLLRAQSPEAREAIRNEVRAAAARFRGEAGDIELPMPAVLATAAKA
jgi:ubiquinone/menaquinone biosynthesis C-methylase UbiE